jgi:hypothetical protein
MTDHARAIEVGARAAEPAVTDEMKRIRALFSVTMDDKEDLISYAKEIVRLRAAIASGELVPATAVAAERERCAQFIDQRADRLLAKAKRTTSPSEKNCFGRGVELRQVAHALRALSPEPASGEFVVVPRKLTPDMIVQGYEHVNRDLCEGKGDALDRLWSAMLNAAGRNGDGK